MGDDFCSVLVAAADRLTNVAALKKLRKSGEGARVHARPFPAASSIE
jgi:hypothetical protein